MLLELNSDETLLLTLEKDFFQLNPSIPFDLFDEFETKEIAPCALE
jgi:hypothetical protein